jgi:dinuclear metal center YbgI/SA1388 family protein
MTATVADWAAALDAMYPPAWAEDWDAVGLVTGHRDAVVERALFAVDPTAEVVAEAVAAGAQLLVTHHPLLLRGVTSVAETTAKGRVVSELVRAGIALFVAHTNADSAPEGVSATLGRALGVQRLEPLVPPPPEPGYKLVTFVPEESAAIVIDALSAAGAGVIGDYTRCAWMVAGTGTYVPGADSSPAVGEPGQVARTPELRIEMVLPHAGLRAVVRALLAAHPYEEPAYDVLPTSLSHDRGLGRVGDLESPVPLGDFAAHVARSLPWAPVGVRVSGHLDRLVSRVAVCGGAGDGFIGAAARAGADVYVTADLRHHVAQDAGLALVDAGHWATEWPWLAAAADGARSALGDQGHNVETVVSTLVTDPWTATFTSRTTSPGD